MEIKVKSWSGLVRATSGLFITKENPNGLSIREMQFISSILELNGSASITKDVKIKLSDKFNQSLQVTTNYINRLKRKGVILKDDHPHSVFFNNTITIKHDTRS